MWSSIACLDEKKFILDGPSGYTMRWKDNGDSSRILGERHSGGGGVMSQAAFAGIMRVIWSF